MDQKRKQFHTAPHSIQNHITTHNIKSYSITEHNTTQQHTPHSNKLYSITQLKLKGISMRIECNIIVYQYCIFHSSILYSTLLYSVLLYKTHNTDLNIILGRISGILPPKKNKKNTHNLEQD